MWLPGGHLHRNIYRGVPLRALKWYPSKYQNLKKIRTHPNIKCEENYDPHNIVQIQKNTPNVKCIYNGTYPWVHITQQVETRQAMLEAGWKYKLVYHLGKIRTHWHTKTTKIRTQWHTKMAEKDTHSSGTSLPKLPPRDVAMPPLSGFKTQIAGSLCL